MVSSFALRLPCDCACWRADALSTLGMHDAYQGMIGACRGARLRPVQNAGSRRRGRVRLRRRLGSGAGLPCCPRVIPWFDPLGGRRYASYPPKTRSRALSMRSQPNDQALVHVVDDDAPLRAAMEGLFESVGL